jgi:hypothetical protein
MSDFTFPFKDAGGLPAQADNSGSAFFITNNAGGNALLGISQGDAVPGISTVSPAVVGINSITPFPTPPGTLPPFLTSIGVQGRSLTPFGPALLSIGVSGDGVIGVQGESRTDAGSSGIGVLGDAGHTDGVGVQGQSSGGHGVRGHSLTGAGVLGESDKFDGVFGRSHSAGRAGVSGHTTDPAGLAGFFEGDVSVTGKITHGGDYNCAGNMTVQKDIVLANADCAEDFDISQMAGAEPGTVMVLGQEGALEPSRRAYDTRVAGVISGAGDFKPGIVLDKQQSACNRMPVALLGKVYCKVDAQCGSVDVGDLLTTSATPGHAMKAGDPFKAFGAIIGKALRPLTSGQGLIPILVALQ